MSNSLVHEVNDTDEDAKELSELLAPRKLSSEPDSGKSGKGAFFSASKPQKCFEFKNKLEKSGINVTIRRRNGTRIIDGAMQVSLDGATRKRQ